MRKERRGELLYINICMYVHDIETLPFSQSVKHAYFASTFTIISNEIIHCHIISFSKNRVHFTFVEI